MGNSPVSFIVRQQSARKQTRRMVFLFCLGVLGTCLAASGIPALLTKTWDPEMLAGITIFILLGVIIASLVKHFQLRQGGKVIAVALGGELVSTDTKNPQERKLRNVVEEMAIASGVPVPEIYLLPDRSINAFAAGITSADAVIGVTRGAIENLNREELQGVIAHEFSHILNGDMRLNIRLISWCAGLLFLSVLGRLLLQYAPSIMNSSQRRDDKGASAGAGVAAILMGLLLIVLGAIGVFFGKVIQAAISRQREHLADASAVQFTRNPLGLAMALKKIGKFSTHSYVKSPAAEEAAHLFFAQGVDSALSRLFSTHPPLVERIKLLDPSFDGDFQKVQFLQSNEAVLSTRQGKNSRNQRLASGVVSQIAVADAVAENVQTVGGKGEEEDDLPPLSPNIIPENLREISGDPLGAITLIYAALLDVNSEILNKQIGGVAEVYGEYVARMVVQWQPEIFKLSRSQKLALVAVCTAALKGMSPEQFNTFNAVLRDIVSADNMVDLFEFCVLKNIEHNLSEYFVVGKCFQKNTSEEIAMAITILFTVMAHAETTSREEANVAFQAGVRAWRGVKLGEMWNPEECSFEMLDCALTWLIHSLKSAEKENLLSACRVILETTNLQMTEDEVNLLRAIDWVLSK